MGKGRQITYGSTKILADLLLKCFIYFFTGNLFWKCAFFFFQCDPRGHDSKEYAGPTKVLEPLIHRVVISSFPSLNNAMT